MAPSAEAEKNPAMMSNSGSSAVDAILIAIWQLWRCPVRKNSKEIFVHLFNFKLKMSLKMSHVIAAVPQLNTAIEFTTDR